MVPLYFPVSPVPPFPSLLPAFLRVFPKKSFLYPPCSCTYSLRDLNPTYISLFSYSTYQGAPVPKSLVNANQELKFYSRIVFTSLCICVYPLFFCIVFVLPYYPRTVLHIPSTPLYGLGTPIYPRTLLHIPSTPLYAGSWYSHISPYPSSYILYSLVSFLLSYQYPCGFLNFLSTSF